MIRLRRFLGLGLLLLSASCAGFTGQSADDGADGEDGADGARAGMTLPEADERTQYERDLETLGRLRPQPCQE